MTREDSPSRVRTIGGRRKRLPCGYCFRTLDPSVGDALNSAFVHCVHCKRNFHAEHARSQCPLCGSDQIIPVRVLAPPPLKIQRWRRPIEPPTQQRQTKTDSLSFLTFFPQFVHHIMRLLVLSLLALLFIVFATVIGTYTMRGVDVYIYNQNTELVNVFKDLLDTVLRESAPREEVFGFAALSAGVMAYALFPSTLQDRQGKTYPLRRWWRIVGGLFLLASLSILFLKINFFGQQRFEMTLSNVWDVPENREILLAQIGAGAAVFVLAFIFRSITRNPPLPPKYPPLFTLIHGLVSLLRYGAVCYFVMRLAISNAALQLEMQVGLNESILPVNFNQVTGLEANTVMIALATLAVATWLYHIPRYRLDFSRLKYLDTTVRIIIFLICIIAMGGMYSRVESDLLLESVAMGAGWAAVLVPIQRAFS